jgi:hypothetical protein
MANEKLLTFGKSMANPKGPGKPSYMISIAKGSKAMASSPKDRRRFEAELPNDL